MNLNSIILSDSLVAELYPSELVDMNAAKTADMLQPHPVAQPGAGTAGQAPGSNPAIKYLGNNQKKILIITEDKQAVYLPDHALDLLTGILSACKLSLDEVAVINLAGHPGLSYKELTTQLQTKVMLLFDSTPSRLGLPLNFPHFQIQPFDGVTYLSSPGLSELEHDKVLKSKLWVCLKRLFNL